MPLLAPPISTQPDLSVVILNWNARDYLVAALASLTAQEWQHAIEVIVVDNASHLDDSVATVRRDFSSVQLIANTMNVGFSAGNNIGLRAARGRYILFLNPDTVVHPGALDTLIDWMDAHPQVGACGPKLLNPDGSLQASCRAFPSLGAGFFRNTPLGRLFPNNPWTRSYLMQDFAHDRETAVDWLSGSAPVRAPRGTSTNRPLGCQLLHVLRRCGFVLPPQSGGMATLLRAASCHHAPHRRFERLGTGPNDSPFPCLHAALLLQALRARLGRLHGPDSRPRRRPARPRRGR